jgi:hypothetical protein
MNTHLLKDAIGWGFLLWLVGYILGIALFFVLPTSAIGWAIMPVGIALTLWVATTQVSGNQIRHFLIVACTWTAFAVLFDYLFIVKAFNPEDGYYKLDVYLYYTLTFLLPLEVGRWRTLGARGARVKHA